MVREQVSFQPRGLRAERAAAYLDMSKTKFLELVDDNRLPQPVPIDGMRIWDRIELDAAFDAIKVAPEPVNSFDAILGLKQ
jgi:predicted DNA-binding transcriptional regulator AlpA